MDIGKITNESIVIDDSIEVNRKVLYRCVKRLSDIILSIVALVILSPVFLIVAILIHAEDGGPSIFRQKRSGLNG